MMRGYVLVLLLMISTTSFGQEVFKPGKVVFNNGSEEKGLLSYFEGSKRHKSVIFKAEGSQVEQLYTPGSIKSFEFENGEAYLSIEITEKEKIEKTSVEFQNEEANLSTKLADTERLVEIFSEIILRARLSLLKYENEFFVEQENGNIIKLEYSEEVVEGRYGLVNRKNRDFIGILSYLFQDCPQNQKDLKKLDYTEASLLGIFKKYYACTGEIPDVFQESKPKFTFGLGLKVGLEWSDLSVVSSSSSLGTIPTEYDPSVSPMGGLNMIFAWPRMSERVELALGIDYYSTEYFAYEEYQTNLNLYRDYVTIGMQNIKVPVTVIANWPVNKFSLLTEVGFSGTFTFNQSTSWVSEIENNGNIDRQEGFPFVLHSNLVGALVGAGLRVNPENIGAFSLMFRFGFGNPLFNAEKNYEIAPDMRSNIKTLNFLLIYDF